MFLFGRLLPREREYFRLFDAHAAEIVNGARALAALMKGLGEGASDLRELASSIDAIEKRADGITRQTVQLLHRSFVTPLDREEIHKLISAMDDCLDLIQDCAESVSLYDVKRVPAEAALLAEICVGCAERVQQAVAHLANAERNGDTIMRLCEEIDRLETDADRVMRSAMSRLFRTERDAIHLIKMKAIYELLETVTDRCEDVAHILEGIVIDVA